MAKFALEVTRLAFSLMQAVSPRLAGEAAFRLFCRTPPARPKGEKARAAHAAGLAKLAGAERFLLPVDGRRAHAYRLNGGARGRRKRYLVTHGWGSGMAYMADLVTMLAESGAEVIALDFPGHGRAGGRFLHMALAVKAIQSYVPGYQVHSLALPLGVHAKNPALERDGEYQGTPYHNDSILLVGSGTAPSPYSADFNPFRLERIQAGDTPWGPKAYIAMFKKDPSLRYVSDGNNAILSAPMALRGKLAKQFNGIFRPKTTPVSLQPVKE